MKLDADFFTDIGSSQPGDSSKTEILIAESIESFLCVHWSPFGDNLYSKQSAEMFAPCNLKAASGLITTLHILQTERKSSSSALFFKLWWSSPLSGGIPTHTQVCFAAWHAPKYTTCFEWWRQSANSFYLAIQTNSITEPQRKLWKISWIVCGK